MTIEFEVLKGLGFGAYLLFVASLIGLAEFGIVYIFTRDSSQNELTINRGELFLFLIAFTYMGTLVGFLLGFTSTPGTVSSIVPAVLTFVAGVFGFAAMYKVDHLNRVMLSLMVISFNVALMLFLFVGLRIRSI